MSSDPFTIRIFVPDGDPEGVRIIDRLNWTGKGIVFPRSRWVDTRKRPEFDSAGVYILIGEDGQDDDLPTLYIGEGDGIRERLDSHERGKAFWSWAVAFVSTNRALNKAHVQWLEHALVDQATRAGRCRLDNGNVPREPELSESERADTRGFLKEVLRILPLVGLRAFEIPRAIAVPPPSPALPAAPVLPAPPAQAPPDTIIVPAQKEGFDSTFLGARCWYAIRISGGALPHLRWIAAYQTAPISAITHVAPIEAIEPWGDGSKYKINFREPAQPLPAPIPFGTAVTGSMQGPRYTSIDRLRSARSLPDLLPR